jgi:hypothetical protein
LPCRPCAASWRRQTGRSVAGDVPEPVTPGQLGVLVMTALYQAQIQTQIRDNRPEA